MPGLIENDKMYGGNGLRICIIGAGISGICAAIRLQTDLDLHNFQIFEMNKGIGGTWLSNTYPGAACDIPIHTYCFSFEKRADWRAQYANQSEILDYMKEISEKYDLYRRTYFSHKIKRMTWDKEGSQWTVDIEDLQSGRLFEKTFDIVFNATGSLRVPKIPEEFKSFKGQIIHTALWNDSINLENKNVGVIGTGASGIQVIPQIAKVAKKLVVYQRSQLNGNKELHQKLTPNYVLGCRRVLMASDYYPTYFRPNTNLVTSQIQKVTGGSIITEEGEEQIDVLVLATGFKVTDYFGPMELYDKNGKNVLLSWKKDGPSLYLGITGNSLPNKFILYGPNTSTGHHSVVITVEIQMDFVIKCLREMLQRNARVIAIKKHAETSYMKEINEQFPKMVWSASAALRGTRMNGVLSLQSIRVV